MPVQVHFGSGLLQTYEPSQRVLVIADSKALTQELKLKLQTLWSASILDWVDIESSECEVMLVSKLANKVWKVLETDSSAALVAIGGGTVMDIAKIIRWRMPQPFEHDKAIELWRKQGQSTEAGLFRHLLICWPTTAGTGSEVSASATLWDRNNANPKKLSWQPNQGHADEAWVDPALTKTCPTHVTIDSALDALSHALESVWNKRSSIVTHLLAKQATRLILKNLPLVHANSNDDAARNALSEAALLSGMAMSETQTALAHALSYDLTLNEKISHGQAVAIWLPCVAELACESNATLQQQLSEILQTKLLPWVFLQEWLSQFSIRQRCLTDLPEGKVSLQKALTSARGKNQIIVESKYEA